jgi:ArsR family transcriptional regulator, arsenate/arsenite/antimonite-responsive transcriptional repressor
MTPERRLTAPPGLGRHAAVTNDQAAHALSALGHETRLALFRMLVQRGPDGLSAGVIAERLGVPSSSLTFHLQHLHRAGLITQRRLHRQLIYAADYAAMQTLLEYLTENCCGRGRPARAAGVGRPSPSTNARATTGRRRA